MTTAALRFFLGSITPTGFVSYTESLYDAAESWQVYILKGGPGTGKSTFLQRVSKAFSTNGDTVEAFHCSADPASLDAIRSADRRLLVIDGTAPHTMDPTCWETCEHLLPLCQSIRLDKLRQESTTVYRLTDEKQRHYRLCRRYLQAAERHLAENRRLQKSTLNTDKICRMAQRLAKIEWGAPTGTVGTAVIRYLTALTPDGCLTLYDTLQAVCPRIYVIEDEHGATATLLLEELKSRAIADGYDVWVCPSPLFSTPQPIHLILPTLGVGFTVSNRFHAVDFPVYRRIHSSRFENDNGEYRARLLFNRRAATEMIAAATDAITQAHVTHSRLESLYRNAMDWPSHEMRCNEWLRNISQKSR